MRIEVVHELPAPPDEVLIWVSELERFPQWTNILHRVQADAETPGPVRAWQVELRGKIGPFARSKRLRMVEIPGDSPYHLRFVRQEVDGLDHGTWNFDVRLAPADTGKATALVVVFDYEGRLWSGAIERLLRDEIESSKRRLTALVSHGGQAGDQAL